jgi:hypothetical protein
VNEITRLQELGLDLYDPPPPGGSYNSVNIRGSIAYVAIQFPIRNNVPVYKGHLGKNLTTPDGVTAAGIVASNILSQINKHVGFEKLIGLNHLDIYYQASGDWDDGPVIANGASDTFLHVLGDKGKHTRALFGVERLSRNYCLGIVSSFTIEP